MNKIDYLNYSLKNRLYVKKDWMIRAFSVTDDGFINESQFNKDFSKYDGQLIRIAGFPFVYIQGKLEKISGSTKDVLFTFKDPITVDNTVCPNIKDKEDTTLGRLLFNLIALVNSFGSKIPYQNNRVKISDIDDYIMKNLDNKDPNKISVKEYKKYVNSLFYLTNFTQLCVWSLTEKLITPPPDIEKKKQELMKKYTDLSDPLQLANFEKELIDIDSEYLKGDPGAEFFQNDEKSRKIIRKRMFLTYGAQKGLLDKQKRNTVTNSLYEGWEMKNMAAVGEALRASSFNRGSQTQLGGELTKWLFRASTGLEVIYEDCGTKVGLEYLVTDNNYKRIIGLYIMTPKGTILIDSKEVAKGLIGKTITLRSPLFCHTKDNNFCHICLGKNMSANKDGISLSIAEIGSMFMLMKMKAMHGKVLATTTIDLNTCFS